MPGLADVDYSDIQAEFDFFALGRDTMGGTTKSIAVGHARHAMLDVGMRLGSYGIIQVEKNNALIAQATRSEARIYGYQNVLNKRKLLTRFGEGLVAKGFVDAIYSVVRDVDIYDPRVEAEVFLKYMLIRSDFIGGQCPKCKGNDAYIVSIQSTGFNYRYKCSYCFHQYTYKSGALFHGSRMPLTTIFDILRMGLDTSNISSQKIAEKLKTTQLTAWRLRRLIRDNSLIADRWPGEHDEVPNFDSKGHMKKPVFFRSMDDISKPAA